MAAFLTLRGDGATVSGAGTLDANGFHGRHLFAENASSLALSTVFFKGSRGWGVHLRRCTNVTLADVKIFSGADGVDPDASSDVSVDRAFIHSWDDAVAVKTTVEGSPAARVAIRDSTVSTRKSALKLGTESLSDFTNVTFERTDVFESGRGLVLYAKDGGTFRNVHYDAIRFLDPVAYAGEPSAPIDFELEHRSGYSVLEGLAVTSFFAHWPSPAVVRGNDVVALENVRLENVSIAAEAPFAGANASFLFDCKNDDVAAGGVAAEALRVDWGPHRAEWLGLSRRWAAGAEPPPAFSLCPDPPPRAAAFKKKKAAAVLLRKDGAFL